MNAYRPRFSDCRFALPVSRAYADMKIWIATATMMAALDTRVVPKTDFRLSLNYLTTQAKKIRHSTPTPAPSVVKTVY